MNLPIEFEKKMKAFLGDEWDDFLYSYDNNRFQALRFNTLKVQSQEERMRILKVLGISSDKRVSWANEAYYFDENVRPGKHPYHEMGLYYIQEPSAMSAAALLAPKPGMRVLDLCAAPGGKSTQLATYLGDSGLLVSNEINTQRSRILSQNIERMGIKNAIVTNEDSFVLASHFPGFFNAIQVDAPCSGEGMFRKLPEAIEQWSMENVAICAARQKEILDNAAVMLKPGGVIVYSTCTFSKEENEDVIEYFLERHPDFTLEEMERFWPHKVDGEGHFVAKLVRRGSVNEFDAGYDVCEDSCNKVEDTGLKADRKTKKNKNSKNRKNETKPALTKENMKLLSAFLDETISEDVAAWIKNSRLVMFGEQLYRLPDMEVDIKGLKVQRAGLHIGEFKKQRFEPSHSLALALKLNDAKNLVKLTCDNPQTTGFFNGQSVVFSDEQAAECKKGWALVCVDGYTAGWGKVNGTQVKNHYPKGLRNKI
ncbi:RsmB/NOP family class I SAM-dependent RNA methyltransferase [Agathobacter rectalis]|uniref:RsmB/NOP family class I SAM-dependent RNA methyltransferase n=1 Tax=Agathobacter rectalis TaxID=39491 RepID=UPI00156F84DE|nr:RsmF rRNA methyltransferase first C-terminal domain-containing protein [Agathobacter rectalis]NSI32649.1 NOL1/NOP2/sun family putative RNA methylase [Agathobacter rectalis]NSI85524.1 NOL1/NOP2/sun family putative RNA methylase [Agathobacter rectalis]